MKLKQNFYNRSTLKVAKELLGKILIRKVGRKTRRGLIVETEAYVGPADKASHASRGKTPRTEAMFGEPGFWYIYLIYGMYYCLNVVTENKDYPAAVLLRAIELLNKKERPYRLASGPGKLCCYFKIDKSLNNTPAFGQKAQLYIIDSGLKIKPCQIVKSQRVGVDYAGEYKDKLWRFYLKNNHFVSKK
ncbi:MAG: DNA-3-methyladenine glycosylase [bacterium]